jgi:ATP-binding cassette subfamily B protein
MSAGEKQIISLARAIIHDPAILIMDEATSHIDVETENIIKESLAYACKGRTVIVIAHRLSTIFNADNIFVLDHGLLVEQGTHEELVKNNNVYANIYRSQVANINQLKNK